MKKKTNTEKSLAASILGKVGGATTKKRYGSEHYQKIGKMAMEKRWGKKVMHKGDSAKVKDA